MAAVDIARVAELSTLALLAAKTTCTINLFPSLKTEAEPFDVRRLRSAIKYLEDALDGLQKANQQDDFIWHRPGTKQLSIGYAGATPYSTRQGRHTT